MIDFAIYFFPSIIIFLTAALCCKKGLKVYKSYLELERIGDLYESQQQAAEDLKYKLDCQNHTISKMQEKDFDQLKQLSQLEATLSAKEEQIKFLQTNIKEQEDKQNQHLASMQEKFAAISHQLYNEQVERIQSNQQKNLGQVLLPFKEQLESFQNKIEQTHIQDIKDRALIAGQIESLSQLNSKLGQEAHQLTQALKGSGKMQGNWGEFMLESVLETAGLRKDIEYTREGKGMQLSNEEGQHQKPDAIIKLPHGQHLIIDAKVTLISYERAYNSEDEGARTKNTAQLVESLLKHIDSLAQKHYHTNSQLNSPEFVIMFVPIEAALSLAQRHNPELFQRGWQKKVIIASPTILLATAMTVASVWRNEQQSENAKEIARQGGKLYDKLAAFVSDFEKIGKQLQTTHTSYTTAWNRLTAGRDTILTNAEKLRELGAQPKKRLSKLEPTISAEN